MRFPGFIGPSYTLQSVDTDCQRSVNLYPEINETGTGKEHEVAALVGTPGLRLLSTLGSGPIRGIYTSSLGVLYVVSGDTLYTLDSSFASTTVGTLGTATGYVSMADNGIQLFVVDGSAQGYYVTLSSNSFATLSSSDNYLGADQVTYQDGYFIFNKPSSQQFYISSQLGVTFDPLDISSAEGSPDNMKGLVADSEKVYLFGTESLEVFYDSGAVDFPFERISGASIPLGTESPFTIEKFAGGIAFLGRDKRGRGSVYKIQGFQPQRISTHAVEKVIASLGDLSRARAWTYRYQGHEFYCLNVPGASTTWCFDAATNLWHERAALSSGSLTRHTADCHAFAYETNVVGDYTSGNVYALDPATYSNNGDPLPRIRTAPHVTKELKRIGHYSFQLDIEAGVGLTTGQGSDPQAMLQWSDDGGHSWSNEHWTTIGARGKTKTRAIWRRLGSSRDRVYKVSITDPVKVTMLGADLVVEEGAS